MGMTERKFNLRIEEMPVISRFLLHSFERDLADFQAYSPDFNEAYRADFESKVEAVEAVVNPKTLIGELKKITHDLYATIDSLRPVMNRLEGYVQRATPEALTLLPEDFGIKPVRAKITSKDQEGLLETLKVVVANIDANLTELQARGWDDTQDTELREKQAQIKAANEAQEIKLSERKAMVQDNMETLNALWVLMQDVADTGRVRLYKFDNPQKAADYTFTKLKKKVRQDYKPEDGLPPVE